MFARMLSGLLLIGLVGCTQSKPGLVQDKPDAMEQAPPVQESKLVAPQEPAPVLDQFILYSIDGLVNAPPAGTVTDDKYFRGYAILGKVEITDLASRQEIVRAIEDGIKEGPTAPAACFWPRHGVHLVADGKAVDYVICYECKSAHVITAEGTKYKTTAATHQYVLNAPLVAAGVKLAPPSVEEYLGPK